MKSRTKMRIVLVTAALAAAAAGSSTADTGETLASYRLTSLEGTALKLADYRGQVVVVNFWASWCAPCHDELVTMNQWNQTWKDRGARVVAISIDQDMSKARRFAERLKLSMTVLHDGPEGLARTLDIPSLPCTYVLDAQGRVVGEVQGSSPKDLEALRQKVEGMLSRRGAPQEAGVGAGGLNPGGGGR